jgi:hypothetical protein
MSWLRIRGNVPGTKLVFKHMAENGAYELKDRKGGINWYWHQDEVLKPKLPLFAKEYMVDRLETVVTEDSATLHRSSYN